MDYAAISRAVLVALSLTWAGVTAGCNRERREAEQLLTETLKSYAQLPPMLAEIAASLRGLHEDIEDLAATVPGGAELRARYFTADEVLGVLDAKLKWLAGGIASAKHDLRKERVMSLLHAIAQTTSDLRQLGSVSIELTHETARLQRVAALLQAPFEYALSTGYRVKAAKDGVESHLLDFIHDTHKHVDNARWLDFDRLEFAGEGADLDFIASRSQLENVAQILRANPAVQMKIAGRADNREPRTAKLWAARALAVKQALIVAGVKPDRLRADGRSPRQAACHPDDAEECEARTHRIAALVTAK
jgi:outer membrane protein OmpA-like peptidoglycan-associated protein